MAAISDGSHITATEGLEPPKRLARDDILRSLKSPNVSLGFVFRVVALWAAIAVALSYGIFVQASQIERAERATRVEMQGNACLARAHAVLVDILWLERMAKKQPSDVRRDSAYFDVAGCSKGLQAWPVLRAQLGHATINDIERRHLAAATVSILNSIGSDSNLIYEASPVMVNLGNAVTYDLPKAQSLMVAAASVRDVLESARLEATANQLLYFTRYDVTTAVSDAPHLASRLMEPMQSSLHSESSYDVQLEGWQKRTNNRSTLVTRVASAERRVLDDTDRVYQVIVRAIDAELSAEVSAERLHLRSLLIAYGCALVVALGFAWSIIAYRSRREERAFLQLHHEMSRMRAESARAEAELELGIREARFQAIFAKSPLPIAISDLNASVVECNEAYLDIVGSAVPDGRARRLLDTLTIEPEDALERIFSDFRNGSADTRQVDLHLTDANQKQIWSHAIVAVVTTNSGPAEHCSIMLQDITDRIEREQRFQHGAMHDPLTGLPNRASLIASLARQLERSSEATPRFALLFVDVDDFKSINDTLGHAAGDESLQSVANKLSKLVRETDSVNRYGGDEFVILLLHPSSVANAKLIATRIARAFETPVTVGEATITISLSVGVIVDRNGYESAEHVLVEADAAMYQMKLAGAKRVAKISRAPQAVT